MSNEEPRPQEEHHRGDAVLTGREADDAMSETREQPFAPSQGMPAGAGPSPGYPDLMAALADMDRKLDELQRRFESGLGAAVAAPDPAAPEPVPGAPPEPAPEAPAPDPVAPDPVAAPDPAAPARAQPEGAPEAAADAPNPSPELALTAEGRGPTGAASSPGRALGPGATVTNAGAEVARIVEQATQEIAEVAARTRQRLEQLAAQGGSDELEGEVVVNAGPFRDISELITFEKSLARIPLVDYVFVRGFEGQRALIDLRLSGRTRLIDEMRARLPFEFEVVDLVDDSLTLDVGEPR
jgi:hypothetical protein